MLSVPINCRRNLNCVRGEKVAFHGPILLYQFAIIKLTSKLETPTYNNNNNKLEIKYQLALPFPGIPTYLLSSFLSCSCSTLSIFNSDCLFQKKAIQKNILTLNFWKYPFAFILQSICIVNFLVNLMIHTYYIILLKTPKAIVSLSVMYPWRLKILATYLNIYHLHAELADLQVLSYQILLRFLMRCYV